MTSGRTSDLSEVFIVNVLIISGLCIFTYRNEYWKQNQISMIPVTIN